MRKLFFGLIVAACLYLSSCGADETTVNAMTKEMCVIMDAYDTTNATSLLTVMSNMTALLEKDGYSDVTQLQLTNAMSKRCPEGKAKLERLLTTH